MDEAVDVPEREVLVLPPVAEKGVHRIRPVDPAARDVPVPQSAGAPAQGGLQATADLLAGAVGAGGLAGLEAVGEPDADDDDRGGGDQDDLVAGARAPAAQQRLDGLEHRHLSRAAGQAVHGGEHALAAGKFEGHGAGALAEAGERLAVAEHRREGRPVGGQRRMGGDDPGIGADHQQAAAGMPLALGHQGAQVLGHGAGRTHRPGGQPGEALDLGLRARQDLGPLALDVERGQPDETGQEHRERSRHGVAQPALGLAETRVRAPHGPGDRETRIRTRGEGSGSRLRHGRTSPVGTVIRCGHPAPEGPESD